MQNDDKNVFEALISKICPEFNKKMFAYYTKFRAPRLFACLILPSVVPAMGEHLSNAKSLLQISVRASRTEIWSTDYVFQISNKLVWFKYAKLLKSGLSLSKTTLSRYFSIIDDSD